MTDADLRARLLDMVGRLKRVEDPPDEYDRLVLEFRRLAPPPQATNFIFHADLPAEEIVSRIMAYQPIQLPGPPPRS